MSQSCPKLIQKGSGEGKDGVPGTREARRELDTPLFVRRSGGLLLGALTVYSPCVKPNSVLVYRCSL